MSIRTTRKIVEISNRFSIEGVGRVLPAGNYEIVTFPTETSACPRFMGTIGKDTVARPDIKCNGNCEIKCSPEMFISISCQLFRSSINCSLTLRHANKAKRGHRRHDDGGSFIRWYFAAVAAAFAREFGA
jgi:hypothetical protein